MTSASGSHEWFDVASVDALEDGDAIACDVGGRSVALYRIGGRFHATDDICTHAHAHLSDGWIDGEIVECPLHQGRFHIPTGRAISTPVTRDVETFPTRVDGDRVLVAIPARDG